MSDAVIIDALRTPIGALGGVLSTVRPDDLAALVIRRRRHRDPSGSASGPPEPERAT